MLPNSRRRVFTQSAIRSPQFAVRSPRSTLYTEWHGRPGLLKSPWLITAFLAETSFGLAVSLFLCSERSVLKKLTSKKELGNIEFTMWNPSLFNNKFKNQLLSLEYLMSCPRDGSVTTTKFSKIVNVLENNSTFWLQKFSKFNFYL